MKRKISFKMLVIVMISIVFVCNTYSEESKVSLQLIRNATMKLNFGGIQFLTDPMLSDKGAFDSFAGVSRNPTVDLPFETDKILNDIDTIIITHTHPDHIDDKAIDTLNKDTEIICPEADFEFIKKAGFRNITVIKDKINMNGIRISRIDVEHGSGEILEYMGKCSGYVFEAENCPTILWTGDSVLCEKLEKAIIQYKPDIIIAHCGGAIIKGFEETPILLDISETIKLKELSGKETKIIAVHMESLDHCPVTRKKLREEAEKQGISKSEIIIPEDGEIIEL